MTSVRKINANRINAQASTGPKSAAGKKRSAANARRHGLAVSVGQDPDRAADIEVLAQHIAGTKCSSDCIALARQIAEAHIELLRVREVRRHLLGSDFADSACPSTSQGDQASDVVRQLEALDRYEQRSMSRRNRAIQNFDTATVLRSVRNVRDADSHATKKSACD